MFVLQVTMKNEAVIMIIAGILYLANCFLIGILLPESIDPAYSKNSSLKQVGQKEIECLLVHDRSFL